MVRQFSGKRLKERRTAAGLRAEQLAVATGLSFHSIRQIERGERTPSMATLTALVNALDISTDSLFEEVADVAA